MSEEIIYIQSNFGIANVKNGHPVVIFKNFRFWWKNENKNLSVRYVCSEKNCFASIRIEGGKVVKQGGKHYHDPLTDDEIVLLKATQELKEEVNKKI